MTTYFVGNHYEVTNGVVTKYYFAGATRLAVRTNGTLSFLLGDHLGSSSVTTNASGNVTSELRYSAWGDVRYQAGTTPTNYTYTGQYSNVSDFGLMFYGARWYDSSLGRFTSPDTMIPQGQGVQAWDRYAYVNNNPVRYNDPTGHCIIGCTLYSPSLAAAWQAIGLVAQWATGTGEQNRLFGPEQPITQEVMQQSGVDDFREAWAASGYEDGFSAPTTIEDDRSSFTDWAGTLIQSHFVDLPLSLLGVEGHSAIPGTIGSLDQITAKYTEDGKVIFMVQNTMGLESGTRAMNWSLLPNIYWSGPLGTTYQSFYWYEDPPEEEDESGEEMQ